MKNIVIFDEYNEIDLKPSDLLHKYIELTENDVATFFIKPSKLKDCTCPGCHGSDIRSDFIRFGLRYVECAYCRTLYISPRPDEQSLSDYYRLSAARNFWRDELSTLTLTKRREKIIKPRFEWILDSTTEYLPDAVHIVDINTDQYGYMEAMAETALFQRKTLLYPFLHLNKINANTSIHIISDLSNEKELEGRVDVVTIFEVADRIANVDKLFGDIHRMLRPDGLCFMTDILISGFDLQTLWDKAENIFPPDRLNVFSVEGLNAIFARHHFECLEFSTPGILDVEIVEKAIERQPDIDMPRFLEYLLHKRGIDTRQSFQGFLQGNLLSSYGRILLRKY